MSEIDDDGPAQASTRDVAVQRRAALQALVEAYDGNTYRLLRELGDLLGASIAYVDRDTIDAHLERPLSDTEWVAVNDQFGALDFDDHVGEQGRFRTDWIETILSKAGVPGHADAAGGPQVDRRTVHRAQRVASVPTGRRAAPSRGAHDRAAQSGSEIGW